MFLISANDMLKHVHPDPFSYANESSLAFQHKNAEDIRKWNKDFANLWLVCC